MEDIKAFLERLEKLPEEVNVNAVFGEPKTVEGRTLIPVAELSYGFGMGAGTSSMGAGAEEGEEVSEEAATPSSPATGGGGGAGIRARPIAYIDVGPDGAQVRSIMDEQKVALAGILLSMWAVGWVGLVLKTIFTRRS